MWDESWLNWITISGLIIALMIGTFMLGTSAEQDNILKACASTGEIEMQSGALKVHIKCSIDRVGV